MGLTDGTTYNLRVIAFDKAENQTPSSIITQTTEIANVAPSEPIVTFSSKTDTSLTVTARATDANGDKLNYTLYAGTTSGNLNKVSNVVTQTQNQIATITVSGLNSYEYYYWRVDVSDGKATTKGAEQSRIRTYCYTTLCSGGYSVSNGKSCSICGGDGAISSTSECSQCDGSGQIQCTGSYIYTGSYVSVQISNSYYGYCENCGNQLSDTVYITSYECNKCGDTEGVGPWCCKPSCATSFGENNRTYKKCTKSENCLVCNGTGIVTTSTECSNCGGDGKVTAYYNCVHGYSSSHYWCTHGNNMGVKQHD